MGISQTKGREYEEFVEYVYQALLHAEAKDPSAERVELERNKIITSRDGTKAEIDVYWEFTLAGITHRVAIECKNYSRTVDISKVRDFAHKIAGLGGIKGLMVSQRGFSQEAIDCATGAGIDLIVMREQRDEDWEDRLTTITVRLIALPQTQITAIRSFVDKEWATSVGYEGGNFNGMADVLMIEDRSDGFSTTFHELYRSKEFSANATFDASTGIYTWRREFTDGWFRNLQDPAHFIKLRAIEIDYIQPEPIKDEFSIDFKKDVMAIMEYMQGQKEKFVVLSSGIKKPY